MQKTVIIDGREAVMRASALLPRQYRYHFGRDLIVDIKKAFEASGKSLAEIQADAAGAVDAMDMTVFENLAWLIKSGGEDVGANPEEWLGSIDDAMTIYNILPAVLDLWIANTATTAKPKKK